MAAPLVAWFGYTAWGVRPTLAWDARAMLDGSADLLTVLQFLALFGLPASFQPVPDLAVAGTPRCR